MVLALPLHRYRDPLCAPPSSIRSSRRSTALPGVGPQLAKLFERLAGPLVVDLLWHLPSGIVDRRASPPIRELRADQIVTITVRVEAHQPGYGQVPGPIGWSAPTRPGG